MKKFLLSLLCLISFMAINANEVAFVADGATYNGSAPTVTIANGADGNIVGLSFTNKDITITHTKKQSNKSNVNSGAVRWYQSDLLTFTPASGITITKIEAIIASGSKGVFAAQVGTVTGDGTTEGSSVTWEGSTTEELILTASKQVRFTYLIVTYTTSTGGGEEPGEGGGEEPGDDPVVPEIPTEGDTYRLVTSDSELEANEKYIIVAAEYDYAMSTTQNSNNRGQNSITKNGNLITLSDEDIDNVQVLTLEQGTIDDTWAFNTGSGYLYAAGGTSKNNYLRTKNNKDEVASAIIAVSTEGIASIVFQGEVSRNTLKYNPSGSLFACYAPDNSQKDVSLYKYIKTVATPVISKDGDDMISITCATEGATIYYTIDGTTPTTSSTQYTDAFKLTVSSLTVNAIAVKDGWKNSTVASEALVPVAIEEVGVDASEAVYYNLQGVKVANPENGIFIKKQGAKATKVVL